MDPISRTRDFFNRKKRLRDVSPIEEFIYRSTCERIPRPESTTYALDVGCNRGRYTIYLARNFTKVWGIDFAEIALQAAERAENIEYVCLDVEKNSGRLSELFPGMDLVITIGVFEMLENPFALARSLLEVVRPGGYLFVMIPNRFSFNYVSLRAIMWVGRAVLGRNWYIHNNGITPRLLQAFLRDTGFEIIEDGTIVGVPAYLLQRLPRAFQHFLLRMDSLFKAVFQGGYYWISVRKSG